MPAPAVIAKTAATASKAASATATVIAQIAKPGTKF